MRAKESDKTKSEKRKAPEEKTEEEVCANGCWCGLFVVAVCLCLEKTSVRGPEPKFFRNDGHLDIKF